ncbi:hypothetical protein [uncultured Roseibium sp.]|uniref:hypothetical protein n=1 Tax=uncultured Roseibium sp. TaxID=1936171 RepID=UPI00374949BF
MTAVLASAAPAPVPVDPAAVVTAVLVFRSMTRWIWSSVARPRTPSFGEVWVPRLKRHHGVADRMLVATMAGLEELELLQPDQPL